MSVVGPLKRHTGWVCSAAFSSDGSRIVSGSVDKNIQLWDSHTGAALAEPFQGHDTWVNSVAFSIDDHHVISGSPDRTIRVWDSHWVGVVEAGGAVSSSIQIVNYNTSTSMLEADDREQYTSAASPKDRDENAPCVELVDVGIGPPREVEIVSSKMVSI